MKIASSRGLDALTQVGATMKIDSADISNRAIFMPSRSRPLGRRFSGIILKTSIEAQHGEVWP